jgi:hypothetical protein
VKTQVIERHFSAVLRSLLTISILANLYACASSGHKNSLPIPKFESVVIVNKGATEELKARFGTVPEDSRIGAGAATGAMLAGTGTAMFCGPFFLLCAIGTVGFATLGAVGGGLAGAAVDAAAQNTQLPPNEQLLLLDKQFVDISRQRTLHLDIEDSLKRQIPPDRQKDISQADALLQFRLYDVRFTEASKRKYALTLKTVMLVSWNRDLRQSSSTHRTYEHTSQALPIENWIQDEGKTLNQAFDTCIAGLTEKMTSDIQFH